VVAGPRVLRGQEKGEDLPLRTPLEGEKLPQQSPVKGVILQLPQLIGLLQGPVGLLQTLFPIKAVHLGQEEQGLPGLLFAAEEGLAGEALYGGVVIPLVQGLEDPLHRR
jgi:hypothetical protein